MVIDVANATEAELKELPNIGTAWTRKIVQLREEKGLTMKDLVLVSWILQKEWARLYQESVILLPFEESELVVPDTTPPASPGADQGEETLPSPRSIMLQRQMEDMIKHHQQAMDMREAYFEKDRIKMIENMEALERQVASEKAQCVADAKATTHRGHCTHGRQQERHRSPAPPKMQTFHGEVSKWKAFRFQFESFANSFKWDDATKLDRLMWSLRDKAVDFIIKRPVAIRSNYKKLVIDLEKRFGQIEPPSASRRQLSYVKQDDSEEIDDFAERVHQLVIDGYPGIDDQNIEILAVDAFLRGCNNKLAALMTAGQRCTTLHRAVRRTKENINDQKAIGKPTFSVRQVSFTESPQVPSRSPSPVHVSMPNNVNVPSDQLAKIVADAVTQALALVLKSSPNRVSVGNKLESPRVCFSCRKEGHIARDCPQKSGTPSSSPNKSSVMCFKCGKQGHYSNNCSTGSPAKSSGNESGSLQNLDRK